MMPAHLVQFSHFFGDVRVAVPAHHFEVDGAKVEAVEHCQKYLNLLDKTVQEFLEAHAPADAGNAKLL